MKSALARSSFSAKAALSTESIRVKQPGGSRGLVFLQMADHVPRRIDAREMGQLRFPFLHAIFAEMADSGFV